jgi:hypothetical protein
MEIKDITPRQAHLLWGLLQQSSELSQAIEVLQEFDLLPMNSNALSREWIGQFLIFWGTRYQEYNKELAQRKSPLLQPKSDFEEAMQ